MSDNVENSFILPKQEFNIVVTSSNNITPPQLPPTEQVCLVITDSNQPKQLCNSVQPFFPKYFYLGHEVQSIPTPSLTTDSSIPIVASSKSAEPILSNMSFIPTYLPPPQIAKNNPNQPLLGVHQDNLPSSTSSSGTIGERVSDSNSPDYRFKNIDRRLRKMEQLMKQSIKVQKQTQQSQMRMEHYLQQALKNPTDQPLFISSSNRTFQFHRHSAESQPPQLYRYSSNPDNTAILTQVESSSPSDSPAIFSESHKEDSNSPNLTIDLNCPILIDSVGQRSPHKYHSHSCSMYNKSIRNFSDAETIEWMGQILPVLGSEVTTDKIQEVLSQTNTITHFTAEFQKVVFTNNERKTLTTSGKFRKRKLERIVLGPLDTSKLQGIIQLSLYLFGVSEKDEERVKYQLKQAIDEKNRREFYREDRGTKRIHLSSVPN